MGKHRPEKEILEGIKQKHPRRGFDGFLYFKICNEAYNLVEEKRLEYDKLIRSSPPRQSKYRRSTREELDLLSKIREQESVAIAFAAMCLEACIWDYAACGTSQNKAKDNFMPLNLVGKWVIIPKLLCGSDITQLRMGTTCILDKLRKLKKARDSFVHPKSSPLPNTVKEALGAICKRNGISVSDAFELIRLLLVELEKVDKTNWWFFQTPDYKHVVKGLSKPSTS
ncbi:hypothetical protein ACFL5Z_19320 [Planctomycetota bacterium]